MATVFVGYSSLDGACVKLRVVLLLFPVMAYKIPPNALRVSRAASLPRSASSRAASHNQNRRATGRDSGVGLHALVRWH